MTSESTCSCGTCTAADLPVSPFEALRVSYGMLLGEDDFRVLMGNPRGKHMLHGSWLHGSGVVWGFDVCRDGEVGLRASPGLALDGLGRELALDASACLDLRGWLQEYDHPASQDDCEQRTVHSCLVAEFDCQPTRPVPTLADPCDVTRKHDDDSRILESAGIVLRPEPCPQHGHPYHRVRVLLGLDRVGADDRAGRDALAARREVEEVPANQRAGVLLRAFRQLAAEDSMARHPAAEPGATEPTRFPLLEKDAAVPLACVQIDVLDADGCTTIQDVRIDPACRTALLPTATIQELTCALAPALLGSERARDAGGPRIYADGAAWSDGERIVSLPVSAPLVPGSVRRAVAVTSLSGRGWVDEDIDTIRYESERPAIVVEMADRPVNPVVRVVVRGTGHTPVYGSDPLVPLAGLWGGPPGAENDGHDAVLTFTQHGRAGEQTGDEAIAEGEE